MSIEISRVSNSRLDGLDLQGLPFGKVFSDHMLLARFQDGKWGKPSIIPFGPISFCPSLTALHHGQAVFEGLKVFLSDSGVPLFFRLQDNFNRMNLSAQRMCMPPIPESVFMDGLKELVQLDQNWIPNLEGYSLYVRPLYFSSDEAIGVKPSDSYTFVIMTTPAGPYFTEPLRVWIETDFSRSAEGGTGAAKAAGNYGGAMYPTKLANEKGFHQIIWTDAAENKWLEESGAMNLMLVANNTLITPSLSNSKLAGITRDTIIRVVRDWGISVQERNISVDELVSFHREQKLQECFGVGTAANIAPVAIIGHRDTIMELPNPNSWSLAPRLNSFLIDFKRGRLEDKYGWLEQL